MNIIFYFIPNFITPLLYVSCWLSLSLSLSLSPFTMANWRLGWLDFGCSWSKHLEFDMVVDGNFVLEVKSLADVVESRLLGVFLDFFVKNMTIFLLVFLTTTHWMKIKLCLAFPSNFLGYQILSGEDLCGFFLMIYSATKHNN